MNQIKLGLDPSEILRAQGMDPDPWQVEVLRSNHKRLLLNCSRGAGKSRTCSAIALHTALFQPESLCLLLSRSQRQSGELFRYVKQGYQSLKGLSVKATAISATQLELSNGSRIVCLPGKEETIRSFQGVTLLLIDEAARVPDDLYRAVRPMLGVSQGRLIALSTPFGQRGWYFQEWSSNDDDWQRVKITATDNPRISAEFLSEELRRCGQSWVDQEYYCSFESLEGLVYTGFREDTRCDFDPVLVPGSTICGGIDFGFRNPFAAVWGFLDKSGVLFITNEYYQRERTIQEHAPNIPKQVCWYADPAGAEERAQLRKAGYVIKTGNNSIKAGIAAVKARIQTGRLKVVGRNCPNLLHEASLYRWPTQDEENRRSKENPIDDNNHALDALRYLVSRIDTSFVREYLKLNRLHDIEDPEPIKVNETVEALYGANTTPSDMIHDEALWHTFN